VYEYSTLLSNCDPTKRNIQSSNVDPVLEYAFLSVNNMEQDNLSIKK